MLDDGLHVVLVDPFEAGRAAPVTLAGLLPADRATDVEEGARRALAGETVTVPLSAAEGSVWCAPFRLGSAPGVLVLGEARRATASATAADVVARRYQALVESLPEALVLIVDVDLRITYAAGSVLGREPGAGDAFVGLTVVELALPSARDEWLERYRRVLAGETLSFDETLSRYGTDFWVQMVPLRGREDEVVAAMVIAQDISSRKQVERDLERLSEERRRIVDGSPIGLAVLSPSGSWLQANGALCRLVGYSEEELLQLTFQHITHPADLDTDIAQTRALLAGGLDSYRVEKRFLHRDGQEVWAELQVSAIWEGDEPALLIAQIQDLTAARAAEDERRRLDVQLREAQKLESLGILAGGVAHDFNNILVGMLGNASMILEQLPAGSPLRARAESIVVAADRAASLTQQMLAYSGKGRFVMEDIDLNQVVGEMNQLVGASLSRNAVVAFELADGLPPVRGDAGQVRQVVMNLLTNAVEALEGGAGNVRVRTAVAQEDGGDAVLLEVSDDGVGMDGPTRERIFEPFFTTKFTGRGLGLAATQGIVRGHGGTLAVESAPGEGTTFRLLLPAVAPSTGAASGDGPEDAPPAGRTVLVVDDDPTVCDVAEDILALGGYRTLRATGGAEALEIFEAHLGEIDAVLLDVMMPGLDCEQIVAALRRLGDVPIVLSSGYNQQVLSAKLVDEQVASFLQKPYQPHELRQAIADAIAAR